ncbi:MAG: hypothetical protein SO152_05175 [Ruminococcus sp.]|nr:hypothetical protein [Ruminococcus sp.]
MKFLSHCGKILIITMTAFVFVLCSLSSAFAEDIPVTDPPVETVAPATEAPVTEAPVTESPETLPPETEAPVTEEPETLPPETEAPVTEEPETLPPETEAPETEAPETEPEYTEPYQEEPEVTQAWTEPQTYDVNELPTLPESNEIAEDLPTAIGADSDSGGVSLVGGIVCWIGVGVSLAVIIAFLLSTRGKNKVGIGRYESGNKIGGHHYQNNIRYK